VNIKLHFYSLKNERKASLMLKVPMWGVVGLETPRLTARGDNKKWAGETSLSCPAKL